MLLPILVWLFARGWTICRCYGIGDASLDSKSTWKIINGEPVDIKEFPYMVSLQYNGTFFGHDYDHFCCGSIISDRWVITSAQCSQARSVDHFHVRVGSSEYYKNGAIHKVEQVLVHPNFDELTRDYDVALLKLRTKITFDQTTGPINLPKSCNVPRTNLTIAGWGASKLLGPMSDKLLASSVEMIPRTECQSIYGSNAVTEHMFCTFTEGFGPCVGDSGSPAVYKNNLIGLTSWSYGCAYENPSVYLKVIHEKFQSFVGAISDDEKLREYVKASVYIYSRATSFARQLD
ncbi:trypsin 5G1-like [Copidosoma floridanum]|uniref:trypsin 5G1-like n=1 Tax=Copidosoma floridanum TaxID=29053 RepID=UPI0006C94118|nr:trypsin 5G1-like [Copidosoma floridanum]